MVKRPPLKAPLLMLSWSKRTTVVGRPSPPALATGVPAGLAVTRGGTLWSLRPQSRYSALIQKAGRRAQQPQPQSQPPQQSPQQSPPQQSLAQQLLGQQTVGQQTVG